MKNTLTRLKYIYKKASVAGTEYYNAPYRAAIARAQRDKDDLFMLCFHDWHLRMGMERSPYDHFRCC